MIDAEKPDEVMPFANQHAHLPVSLADSCPLSEEQVFRVARELLRQIATVHADGRLVGMLDPARISLVDGETPLLPEATFDNVNLDNRNPLECCPPEFQSLAIDKFPLDIISAQKALAAAKGEGDPRRLDIYQWGTLVCRLATGLSVSAYLNSPRARSQVPADLRPLVDQALGYNAAERFSDCSQLRVALDQVIAKRGSPTAETPNWGQSLPPSSETPFIPAMAAQRPSTIQPAEEAPASMRTTAANHSQRELQANEQLGPYRILRRIGGGGMGDVYEAYEAALDRHVAIKVLPPELARHADFVNWFRAEATAVAKLVHPNIVQIHSIGEAAGHHYFAMQYVRGESLADTLRVRGKLPSGETLLIVEQCLAGLAAAHQRGLIHRDVKPGNILIDHESQRALLADFGLVKAIEAETSRTATGVILGTVDYMSPEQARGHAVDGRSDLYSLGVLLYQMLSGRLPFVADSPTAVIFQHAYEQPESLAEIAPSAPSRLVSIVTRLMAKDPQQRYQSAGEVLNDIAAYRGGQLPATTAARVRDVVNSSLTEAPIIVLPLSGATVEPATWSERFLNLFRRHAPNLAKNLENTQQQVDGAIYDYQQKRDQLAILVRDAQQLAKDLQAQVTSHKKEAKVAAQKAKSKDPTAAAELQKQQAECERIAADFAQQLAQQQAENEALEAKLANVNATLLSLRSQRDVLQARLQSARARFQSESQLARFPLWNNRVVLGGVAALLLIWGAVSIFGGKSVEPAQELVLPAPKVEPKVEPKIAKAPLPKPKPKPPLATTTNSLGMQLNYIPAGEFQMGSPDTEPRRMGREGQHRVRISKPFLISAYEVTQEEYEAVMGSNPSYHSKIGEGRDKLWSKDTKRFPVENISFENAREFCRKLSEKEGKTYRLPTEAEWEYACRAGTKTAYHFGETCNGEQANCRGQETVGSSNKGVNLGRTEQVGAYPPNDYGLYDMHGNVWEWCSDWFDENYYNHSPIEDPQGPPSGTAHVLRGGSWRDDSMFLRSAWRDSDVSSKLTDSIGFRVVRIISELPPTIEISGIKLNLIPAGEFLMGSPDSEIKEHLQPNERSREEKEKQFRFRITKPFYLGVYEITQGEYERVMGDNPSAFSSSGAQKNLIKGIDNKKLPVEMVSWKDAQKFCTKLSADTEQKVRLPTEAEWEYACRAGTLTVFNYGNTCDGTNANVYAPWDRSYGMKGSGKYMKRPTIVGSYKPNAWGLYDMHGNVYEWVKDAADINGYKSLATDDPRGSKQGMCRGGCWRSWPYSSRSAARNPYGPDNKYDYTGFRIACDAPLIP
jgi:formylglycine-generating enzyme required for sulfatase activity/serine/threonine protein kinase